jgi:hypothetical protein
VNEFGEPNPAYKLRQVSPVDQDQINSLRERIDREIRRLNRTSPSGYYVSEQVYGHASIYGSREHRRHFLAIMNGIETDNEGQFFQGIIGLATVFNRDRMNAKQGLIEAFTHLYVTKEFPSEEVRQSYFHFILRCGQIY